VHIDAAAGGSFFALSIGEAHKLVLKMASNYPTVSQDVNFVGNSNYGFPLIQASMLGGTNPVSHSTTANRVVMGRISTEMSPPLEISS
jgi:hypothetical protein